MSDAAPKAAPTAPRAKHKRKLSNYLLDKKLQLRYVLVVTILSGVIAGALGFMIYQQRREGAQSVDKNFTMLVEKYKAENRPEQMKNTLQTQQQAQAEFAAEDRALVYKMVGVGIGLVIILSLYLLVMTHKVAGPLFKVSMYFDRMADKRLSKVTPLRQGDMLQDFYANFQEMHEAVRARAKADVATLEEVHGKLAEKKLGGGYHGEGLDKVTAELDALAEHVKQRKANLVDFPPTVIIKR